MRRTYAWAPGEGDQEVTVYRTSTLSDAPESPPHPGSKAELAARRNAARARSTTAAAAAALCFATALLLLTGRLQARLSREALRQGPDTARSLFVHGQAPRRSGDAAAALPPFVVFVDAGSTGSRVHVFSVSPRAPPAFRLQAAAEKFASPVPLASLAGQSPADVWAAFAPLLAKAEEVVPPALRPRTPLFVWATAGMRLLDGESQAALYDTLYDVVRRRSGFAVERSGGFRTLEGRDEGVFGWLAANALSGADLTRVMAGDALPRTKGALDLGGGSAQVVSAAGSGASRRAGPLGLASVEADVYAQSYLGFGAVAMEGRVRSALLVEAREQGLLSGQDSHVIDDPCGLEGHEELLDGGSSSSEAGGERAADAAAGGVAVTLRGTGDYAGCVAAVRRALAAMQAGPAGTGVIALPPAVRNDEFMAMALYYHVAHFLSVALPRGKAPPLPRPTPRELAVAAAAFCATPWSRASASMAGRDANTPTARLSGRCFDAVLVATLLTGAPLGSVSDQHAASDGAATASSDGAAPAAAAGIAARLAATPVPLSPPDGSGSVGFGFDPDARRIVFVDKVKGTEVEWTLGAAIASLQPMSAAQAIAARRAANTLALPLLLAAAAAAGVAAHARAQASPAWSGAWTAALLGEAEAGGAATADMASAGLLGRLRLGVAAALRALRGGRPAAAHAAAPAGLLLATPAPKEG